jgi:hypothetical protein
MERENLHGEKLSGPEKLDRLERAMQAVHGLECPLPALRIGAVMACVRAAGIAPAGDARFLWRFLSAAAVAAAVVVAVNLWDGATPETVALGQMVESPWTVLINPSVLN